MLKRHVGTCFVLAAGLAGAGCISDSRAAPDLSGQLKQATLTVGDGRCAAVMVGDTQHALTAAHCIGVGERSLDAEQLDGHRSQAHIDVVDRDRDLAILRFDTPLTAQPLGIAPESPQPGELVLFQGRNDYGGQLQWAEVQRLGRCPSLPAVPDALFTTLQGQKGDSGAPVVDEQMRVVGLVHGGAACHIAAPTADFANLVQALSTQPTKEARR